jgi:alkanesulfonate monooxygenase SsuD/methylene tetrahydromethanopterin reductase-like flavin-dependent oxidoreductase (luciferase family)
MRVGIVIPQGHFGEFEGWDVRAAWNRTLEVARLAKDMGFDSLWGSEHVVTKWGGEQPLFDCWTTMTAVAQGVPGAAIGFVTLCSPFRNPALTAKMAATLDVVCDGRLTLGLGAGWKEAEFRAYGYDFPGIGERLRMLGEHLEIIRRMVTWDEGPATFTGRYARVDGAINNPRGLQRPRIPIMVGGHGPNVTFRLAARYADEMNIDVTPKEIATALPILRQRCEEIGRDPATLAVSGLIAGSWPWSGLRSTGGQRLMGLNDAAFIPPEALADLGSRQEGLALLDSIGCERAIAGVPGLATTDETLYEFAEDCRAAGVALEPAPASARP